MAKCSPVVQNISFVLLIIITAAIIAAVIGIFVVLASVNSLITDIDNFFTTSDGDDNRILRRLLPLIREL